MITVQGTNFGTVNTVKCSTKIGKYNIDSHLHQFSEIVLVKNGSISITVDGRTETARQNDLIIVSPFQVHEFKTDIFCDIKLCLFSNDFISDFLPQDKIYTIGDRAVFTPSQKLLAFIDDKIPDTGEERVHFTSPNDKSYRKIKAALYAIYEEYTESVSPSKTDSRANVISRILMWMKQHYQEDITMSDVASALGYTDGYISHCIGGIGNMNFRTLLNSFRVEHAKELLHKTQNKIIDIALECGFSGERSFHRAFLAIMGTTPGEYRKREKADQCITSPEYKKTDTSDQA
jgi:AraC-like DNA-binding protein